METNSCQNCQDKYSTANITETNNETEAIKESSKIIKIGNSEEEVKPVDIYLTPMGNAIALFKDGTGGTLIN